MDSYYIIVLTIAVIVLILFLTFIGIQMSKPSSLMPSFPPNYNSCPDFWNINGNVCVLPPATGKNSGTIYSGNVLLVNGNNTPGFNSISNTIDFTDPGWGTGSAAKCNQQIWANNFDVLFDGITNFNGC